MNGELCARPYKSVVQASLGRTETDKEKQKKTMDENEPIVRFFY